MITQYKTIACIVARTVSTRLPLKIMRTVTPGYTMLDFILQRVKKINSICDIYICTSYEPVDDILEDVAEKNGVNIYRGSAEMVIERLISVGEKTSAENIIRITGDNVFNAWEYVDDLIQVHCSEKLDYSRIVNLPFGATPEIMSMKALRVCNENIDPMLSEYLTIFMFDPKNFSCGMVKYADLDDFSDIILTVDTPLDLIRTKSVLSNYFCNDKLLITTNEIVEIISKSNIPYSKVNMNANVKLPNNVTVKFMDFLNDLKFRASKSKMYELTSK